MIKGVSIVLCTYNGKSRLDTTLRHLVAQKIRIPCELIFVDNASDDGSKLYAEEWWLNFGVSSIDFRSFKQMTPGKSYAQDLGYAKATYEYILVCDDDNWLCETYIQTAFEIMESNDHIGALGGWCEAEFENKKPLWFDQYSKYYAVSKQGKRSGDITNKKGCLYGAGMVIRKSHWLELKLLGFEHLLSCRKGNSLSSGGDTEYSYALRLLGYSIWYDERLYFKHFMSQARLNFDYLSRLRLGMVDSNFILWPYLDFLRNKYQSRNEFLKVAVNMIPVLMFKKSIDLMVGNYEKRERAKHYFKVWKYRLLHYSLYKKNHETIKLWIAQR
ncbi:glycosyltransferase [Psychroserpens sp. Hel_I_66]|uniref:glycosyltransferase n=1 Tax=Psychroserpens sp. Hel_I_66 TaxID=1250004 RepID=UPI000646CB3C|nr:glycosyltransferase [Psychroserpens sp. Hel_I_66]